MSEEKKPEAKEPPVQERQEPGVSRAPDHKVHYGRIQAAVWRRELDERTIYSVSLTRSYKDKQDQWQRTASLDEEDLLPASMALSDAYKWIQQQRQGSRGEAFHDLQGPARAANS